MTVTITVTLSVTVTVTVTITITVTILDIWLGPSLHSFYPALKQLNNEIKFSLKRNFIYIVYTVWFYNI